MPGLTPTALLFVEVALVLSACGLVSVVAGRLRQPPVLGQMIAGVVLGPSLLGLVAPHLQQAVFPAGSLAVLNALGQLGVVLYMLLVGLELDFSFVRQNARSGLTIALSGVAVPLVLGALLATSLVGDVRFFPPGVPRWAGVLFMAAATAVTAFPVLARILSELGMLGTPLANLCLVCGSFTDVVAWCLLALVLAGLAGSPAQALLTAGGAVVFGALVLFGVRPLLRRARAGDPGPGVAGRDLPLLLIVPMAAAAATEAIGIHPAFGAFLAGAAMPRTPAIATAAKRLRPLVTGLMVPLYFAYAGLHTRMGLIDTPDLVLLTVAVIAVACMGKGVTCWLAARLTGWTSGEAVAIGALMNARGVVELVILTVGLDRHVITPTLFSIMVTMTIVTTLMASPVLHAVRARAAQRERLAGHGEVEAAAS